MEKLHKTLPENICSGISSIRVGGRENTEDTIVWNHPKEVNFSVKSVYEAISKEEKLNIERHWNLIWKWPGNQ